MDATRGSSTGTSFADDFNEFDHLLDDDEETAAPSRTGRMPKVRGGQADAASGEPKPKARAKRARPSLGGGVRITPDWNRIAAVAFVGILGLVVLWFVVNGITDARRQGAYEDYFGKVRDIATQSEAQGDELDSILTDPDAGDRGERIARIEELAGRADKLVASAAKLDVPDQVKEADVWMRTSLEYRASGLDALQRSLSASIDAKDADASVDAVSQALARFVASDVLWADSFAVAGRSQLQADDVEGVTVPDSTFLDDIDVASPKSVSSMLDRLAVATTTNAAGKAKVPNDGKIRGGQLEGGQVTLSPSGQTLVPGQLTQVTAGDDVSFEVPFTNQGQVQLTQVPVKITMRGSESDAVTLTGVIDVVDPGQTATAKIALDEVPTLGELLETEILVGPIPGEKTVDNNSAQYQLQFSAS